MKTLTARSVVCATITALLLSATAYAKKPKPTFRLYVGKYSGAVAVAGPGGTSQGTVQVIITAAKNGKTGILSYAALVNGMPLPTVIKMTKRSAVVSDLGVGIAGSNNQHPGAGPLTLRTKRLNFFATDTTNALTGSARVRNTKKKRKLTLALTSFDGANNTIYFSKLKSKLPKSLQ